MKKVEEMNTLEYMEHIIKLQNYKDSIGVIVLKNGGAMPVDSYFDYFFDTWLIYTHPERKHEIISPMVTNGDMAIHLDTIAAMIKTPNGFEEFEEFEDY